jgi:hypothetical protein
MVGVAAATVAVALLAILSPPGSRAPDQPLKALSAVDWDRLRAAHRSVSFGLLAGFPVSSRTQQGGVQTPLPIGVPARVRALHGVDVSIDGYMLPFEVSAGGLVRHFYLNASYDMCQWGAQPNVNERVEVRLAPGRETPFTHMPIRAYGRLRVKEERDGRELVGLYAMDAVAVGPPGLGY